MGLLDKLKDLFMDEVMEDEEVELEEESKNIYQEPKNVLPTVMRETIKKEEESIKFEELKPLKEEPKWEEKPEMPKVEERKFSFPIEFDSDVSSSRAVNRNVMKEVKEVPKKNVELYPKKEVVTEKPKFKPTPVISPVYGILDKNYKKEEVREKSEDNIDMKRPSKKVDFETVRKKAFGNLTDEIKDNLMCENCELYKEVKRISAISKDDLLYDMMVDEKVEEEVTLEKAYDNYEDYGVAYEPHKDVLHDDSTMIINNNTDVTMAEKVEIKEISEELEKVKKLDDIIDDYKNNDDMMREIPSREEKRQDKKIDDDFFELIDSMYKERIDE